MYTLTHFFILSCFKTYLLKVSIISQRLIIIKWLSWSLDSHGFGMLNCLAGLNGDFPAIMMLDLRFLWIFSRLLGLTLQSFKTRVQCIYIYTFLFLFLFFANHWCKVIQNNPLCPIHFTDCSNLSRHYDSWIAPRSHYAFNFPPLYNTQLQPIKSSFSSILVDFQIIYFYINSIGIFGCYMNIATPW